ncbi:NAD(P)H-binding protein [Pedobacter gandavensis]|uniref:NAD(P)H-binding protein n=1 Tax=Pedobacter gandavensis TaxID=2679963 RepID=A0ABR6ES73_9SPHI|nr:NAD(P)H-binding protein [Pedobacter gandavensis]MBB2148091.1 NAD(P)H-binding protein [Pedobacter gandavensis]
MENNSNMILVLGANGKTGSRVAKKLEALNLSVRKGSRTAQPKFDWEDQNTWAAALDGIKRVYITFQPDLAVKGAEACIAAFVETARKAGVQQLVLLSGRAEPEAQRCEQIVMESGLNWTIVRASWFNQNFSESFLMEPIAAGYVALPVSGVKEPFIDADDIADVVVAALTAEGHDRKIYEVTGPRLISFKEAIDEIAQATNRSIEYVELPLSDYISQMRAYQVPEASIELISYLFREVLDGRNESMTTGVEEALGRKPKDFSQYVKDSIADQVWLG